LASRTGAAVLFLPASGGNDIRRQVGPGIGISAGDAQIFLYAGTETTERDAERIARDVLAGQGIAGASALRRWPPIEEG
jgi:hypothetical protein